MKGNVTYTKERNIGREIFLCFTRVVDLAQIQTCIQEIEVTEVTVGTLLDVMACNERINDKWVVDHINIKHNDSDRGSGGGDKNNTPVMFSE